MPSSANDVTFSRATVRNPLDTMIIRYEPSMTIYAREKWQTHNVFGKEIRTDNKTGKPRDHSGWDLLADENTPVYAISSGTVIQSRIDHSNGKKSYGGQVEIEFDFEGKPLR
jgi:murein DD-endopeptidase MepM/ murein hydrolase activator NlpD